MILNRWIGKFWLSKVIGTGPNLDKCTIHEKMSITCNYTLIKDLKKIIDKGKNKLKRLKLLFSKQKLMFNQIFIKKLVWTVVDS